MSHNVFFLFGSKSIQSFSEQLSELDQIVRKMVLESLGLEKYTDEHIGSTNYLVRVQKYDFPKGHEAEVGLTSHTDKNIVTILYQNEVNGLEVLTKDGQWITAEPSPNSFIVMIGEAFHVSAHQMYFNYSYPQRIETIIMTTFGTICA